ncbi:MAG: NADH-quinone oxidoreductase subunit C [Aquificota bacterium]|nr:MAG: NADH-quinone oxidoreductase subunit C [Aquificota bacterium]
MAGEKEKKVSKGEVKEERKPKAPAAEEAAKKKAAAPKDEAPQEPQVDVDTLPLVKRVKEVKGEFIEDVKYFRGEITFLVKKEGIVDLCHFLKDDSETQFDFLTEVIGTHYPEREKPFEVVYHLYSTSKKHRVRLKVQLAEDEEVESVFPVWRSATWYEREVYDMLGIRFANHPDLKRILLPDDWEGHPLRKDYPLQGPPGYREAWIKAHCASTNKL